MPSLYSRVFRYFRRPWNFTWHWCICCLCTFACPWLIRLYCRICLYHLVSVAIGYIVVLIVLLHKCIVFSSTPALFLNVTSDPVLWTTLNGSGLKLVDSLLVFAAFQRTVSPMRLLLEVAPLLRSAKLCPLIYLTNPILALLHLAHQLSLSLAVAVWISLRGQSW